MDAHAVTDPCFRRHRYPVRVTNGLHPWFWCAWCGDKWVGGRDTKAPQAPPSWERMSLQELRVWYARVVIKARI